MKLGIKKIEFREKNSSLPFSKLNIVHLSGTLEEKWTGEMAGKLSTATISAEVRNSSRVNDAVLLSLVRKWHVYQLTDMQGIAYIIGDDEYMPEVTLTRSIAKFNPNGYKINITYKSISGLTPDR